MLTIINTTPDRVVAEARRYIGVPYRHLGRTVMGLDCLGLLLLVAKTVGQIEVEFDFRDYTQDTSSYTLEQELAKYMSRLATWTDAQRGDVLLQKFHVDYPASHIIIVSNLQDGHRWGIHASSRRNLRRVVEQRITHDERNHAAFRLRGMTHG